MQMPMEDSEVFTNNSCCLVLTPRKEGFVANGEL